MPRKPAEGARERLLETASRLFYEHGVRAVGMQQIIDECGCGKSVLYREFASKDDLVVAWLEHCRLDWACTLARVADEMPGDPAGQLVGIVRAVAENVSDPDYRGCALRNTYAEFPDRSHPAHQVSLDHVRAMRAELRRLAGQAGVDDPETLAARIMLILDGLYTNGVVLGGESAGTAVALAEEVVRAATPATRTTRTT
jgi:AcrR family transcriptional regulator